MSDNNGRISKHDLFYIHNDLKIAISKATNLVHNMQPKNSAAYEFGQLLDITKFLYQAIQKIDTWAQINAVEEYVREDARSSCDGQTKSTSEAGEVIEKEGKADE